MNEKTTHAVGHITPLKVYLAVGASLFILTAITVQVSQIHLGAWNAIVALAIATIKALLVALFFMHLLYDKKIYAIVVSLALVMLSLLIALTMGDILRRGDIYDYQAKPIRPEAEIYLRNTDRSPAHGGAAADTTSVVAGEGPSDTSRANQPDTSRLKSETSPGDTVGRRPGG